MRNAFVWVVGCVVAGVAALLCAGVAPGGTFDPFWFAK